MPTIYRSTDAFAPQLDNTAGSLLAVLDACLVDGYGTGEDAKPAAGWSKPYTGTDKAVYRNSVAAGGTGAHFRVEDSGSAAKLRAHLTMSDVDTGGDNGTPATATYPDGVDISKGGGTALEWILIADDRTVWLSCSDNLLGGFGDFESFLPVDGGDYFVVGHQDAGFSKGSGIIRAGVSGLLTPENYWAMWLATTANQVGSAVKFSIPYLSAVRQSNSGLAGSCIGGSGAPMPDPEPYTGDRFFMPAMIGAEGILRGRLRGLFAPLNDVRALHGETITGTSGIVEVAVLTARSYDDIGDDAGNIGALAVEIDQDW